MMQVYWGEEPIANVSELPGSESFSTLVDDTLLGGDGQPS